MISYKLAKQLKDAGFPQPEKGSQIEHMEDLVWTPDLSELISACGFYFRTLTLHSDGKWTCNYAKTLKKTSNSDNARYGKSMLRANDIITKTIKE